MTAAPPPDTEELLARASAGDEDARAALLQRHRRRLCDAIALRMDRRLAARLDPSDVVQEALTEAARQMDDHLKRRPLPFYPWLRQVALNKLSDQHRRHVRAQRRNVTREERPICSLPDDSVGSWPGG
jgi:RNA polymerase sigma-70 factor, ECF subfamily